MFVMHLLLIRPILTPLKAWPSAALMRRPGNMSEGHATATNVLLLQELARP